MKLPNSNGISSGKTPETNCGEISNMIRFKIFMRDGRRCRRCRKTVDSDQIKLHIIHRIPIEWGGLTSDENLWSLCCACMESERDHLAGFDSESMKSVLGDASVHRRIAGILHAKSRQWVDCDLLESVANFDDHQPKWLTRLRELRYFDFQIDSKTRKVGRRRISYYRLSNWPSNQPSDLTTAAREIERQRAKKPKPF